MSTISEIIGANFSHIVTEESTPKANEALRKVREKPGGLGVAILVAWQHGLCGDPRHIDPWRGEVRIKEAEQDCPYVFVHAPARQYRRDTAKLIEKKLFNPNADPALLVYHEDGLIGTFSFRKPYPTGLDEDDIAEILRALAQHGILVPANIENRQIQFKDLEVKRRIEASGKQVYVKIDHHPMERQNVHLPAGYEREEIWEYVRNSLRYKSACNYCSLQAFSPREVTVSSAHDRMLNPWADEQVTVRNYQFGFTFAPMGDPHDVCHFLAWDFPHISDLVMNMEPQTYSISDLVGLVRVINHDIAVFCRPYGIENLQISGFCNHWAGNSIYHQHYQFVRISHLPLLLAGERSEVLHTYQDVEIRKLSASWPAPAFIIRSCGAGGDEDVIKVADGLAREWRILNEGEDDRFANEIVMENYSQNIFVTIDEDRLIVVFIPRLLDRLDTRRAGNAFQKKNAAILEMMGYFIIDEPENFNVIEEMSALERKALGDAWLAELGTPAKIIQEFEDRVKVCLSTAVDPYEQRIDELLLNRHGDWPAKARSLVFSIDHDTQLESRQREHLYRELAWAVLEVTDGEVGQQSTE